MNSDRLDFYRTVRKLKDALNESLLIDVFPVSDPANILAQHLRRGLVVTAFAAFETYLEKVAEVVFEELTSAGLGYGALPEGVRKMLTSDALTGLSTRMSFLDKADRLQYAEQQIAKLAGFQLTPPKYSSAGFSPRGSNIGHEDVKALFSAFGVLDPWQKIGNIANYVGGGRVSIVDDIRNFSSARHSCAHNADFVIATGDVEGHLEVCAVAAIAIDVLAMKCVVAVKAASQTSQIAPALASPTIQCRFVDMDAGAPNSFLERSPSSSRAYRRHQGLTTALGEAAKRAGTDAVIARDATGKPFLLQWHS